MCKHYFLKLVFLLIIFNLNVKDSKAQEIKYSDELLYKYCSINSSGVLQPGIFVLNNNSFAIVFEQERINYLKDNL